MSLSVAALGRLMGERPAGELGQAAAMPTTCSADCALTAWYRVWQGSER